jgi:DHA1 family multidrug/chloramphenicol efflux transport protein-like MFS transporter
MVYVIASVMCALANNFYLLLIARFIEGSMIASMVVLGYACIHELYERKEAIRILALMGSVSVLAPAFGPLLGSVFLYVTNWRGIFWIIALWASLSLVSLYYWMPETNPEEKRQTLYIRLLLTNYAKIIMNKKFILRMMILGFIFSGLIVWISAGPLLIIETFHYSATAFGIIQAIVFIAYIIGNRLVKYFMEWLGIPSLIRVGLVIILCGGILIFSFALCFPNSLYTFISALMIFSFGSALCFASLNRLVIESSTEPMGVRMAMFSIFISGFAAFSSAMSGVFFDGTITSLSFLIGVASIIAGVFYLFANVFARET